MSDMNKRAGSNDCDDCDERGERGEKGKHGKRGPRGHDGHDGATGPTGPSSGGSGSTGPTGPCCTGPTGPSGDGSTGPMGLAAYGHAVNSGGSDQTVDTGNPVVFNLGGTGFPSAGIMVPAAPGTTFTIVSGGDYEYDFYIAGNNPNAPGVNSALDFALAVNGVPQGPGHASQSNYQGATTTPDDTLVLRGQGIITLLAGNTVTLQNRGPDAVLAPNAAGSALACPNASLTLKKLSS